MSTQVTNYQCPTCTGPLCFEGTSGKLKCDYCGNSYDVGEIEAMYADQGEKAAAVEESGAAAWKVDAAGGEWGEEAEKMREYGCPSCGAQLVCDENTAATSCPYCGNPTVVPGQFGGTLRPDYVLPFKLGKEEAKAALKKHYKGKLLLPKAFTTGNHIEEIKGIYVPFWLFDGAAEVNMTFHATNSKTYRNGDYMVTDTDHYDVRRAGNIAFEKVPVDGSSKMPDDFMDSIEPYDYKELTDFSIAYLPGYLADKYDVDAQTAAERADERCINTAVSETIDTVVGYEDVSTGSQQVNLHRGEVKYALFPVWMLYTKWNGNNYLFAMNGQTGKLVGDLPVDKNKTRAWFWGVAVGVSTILSLFLSGPLGRIIVDWLAS